MSQISLNQRFFDACAQGNVSVVTTLLSQTGVNVNHVINNSSPLSIAITNNQQEIVTELLNHHDVDINKKVSDDGQTALHVACDQNNTAAIEAICLHPLVNVNEKTNAGDTPLMLAIIGGHVEAVRKLVSNDQVNLEDLDYR